MRKTYPLFLLCLVCLGLAGCSSTGPISLGQGKYLISDTNGLYLKSGAVLKDILEEAKTFCAGQGKEFLVHDIKTINSSAVEDAGADLIFSFDVLSAVNDGDSLLCQQLAPLITSVDSCC